MSVHPRNKIFLVGFWTGKLCDLANTNDLLLKSQINKDDKCNASMSRSEYELCSCMSHILKALQDIAVDLNLNLIKSVENKMKLNDAKYPPELCKVHKC